MCKLGVKAALAIPALLIKLNCDTNRATRCSGKNKTYFKIEGIESQTSKPAKLRLLEPSRYKLCVYPVKASTLENEPLL